MNIVLKVFNSHTCTNITFKRNTWILGQPTKGCYFKRATQPYSSEVCRHSNV